MLILTRRAGETLMIGDNVSITVLGVKGNQVRIGLTHLKIFQYIVKKFINAFNAKKHRPLAHQLLKKMRKITL